MATPDDSTNATDDDTSTSNICQLNEPSAARLGSRKTTLVPVITDGLFDQPEDIIRELALLNAMHDVFLVLIDSSFAFTLPHASAGWIHAFDVETGRSRTFSRAKLQQLATRVQAWQDTVQQMAQASDLDVLRLGIDELHSAAALSEFIAERRLRKT